MKQISINEIEVGERHRRDMGDIGSLAKSIASVGLLHPIVVRSDNVLIAGERRLVACKQLGWDTVPVTVVDLEQVIRGEVAENSDRKDFTPLEAVALAEAMEPLLKAAAKERQIEGGRAGGQACGNFPQASVDASLSRDKTRDKVAEFVGVSGRTLEKAKAVAIAAREEPEKFAALAEKMDETGNIDRAFKDMKKALKEARENVPVGFPDAAARCELHLGDIADVELEECSVDFIITDPPYPEEFLPLYGILAEKASRWLRPGGSLLVMSGQVHLPQVMAQLSSAELLYQWTVCYQTLGGQSVQIFPRKVNTFWKPVLWFVNGEYDGDWIGDVCKSEPNDNDKRFHKWGQSESGMADIVRRFTKVGDVICDPFLGGGTTGVVALELNRFFVGIEKDPSTFETAKKRIFGN